MSFTQETFASVGAHSADTPNLYSYKSTDTLSVVSAPDYFLDKSSQLKEGDFILAQLLGYSGLLEVDSTQSGVSIVTDALQKTAHGDLAVAENTPVVEVSAQYGINNDVRLFNGPGGTAVENNSLFSMTSGTNPAGFGSIFSKGKLIFRPGQGEKDQFTARFSAGQVGSEQFGGLANGNSSVGFGYNGVEFATLFRFGGALAVQELTITTPASGAENATITINGVARTVPLTAGTVQQNANEIVASLIVQEPFWEFEAVTDPVSPTEAIVVANFTLSFPITGSFAFSSATAVAAWVQIEEGVLPTDIWTNQADWSDDTFPALVPSNLNSYKLVVGPSLAKYYIEDNVTHDYTLVHVADNNNQNETVLVQNPTFNHSWYALNRGGTTSVTTEGGYASLSREGKNIILAATASAQNTLVGVGTTAIPIISLRLRNIIDNVTNLGKVVITSIQVSSDSTKAIVATLLSNPILTGSEFEYVDKDTSVTEIDIAATAVTDSGVSVTGFNSITFPLLQRVLERGEILTVAVNVTSGAPSEFTVTVSYVEDL